VQEVAETANGCGLSSDPSSLPFAAGSEMLCQTGVEPLFSLRAKIQPSRTGQIGQTNDGATCNCPRRT
jgi:hypothetical protein